MPVDRPKCVKEMLGMGEVVERDLLVAYSVIDIHAIWVSFRLHSKYISK